MTFCDHHSERFWAERNLHHSSEVTAKQGGVLSQKVGIKQSGIAFGHYFSSTVGKPLFCHPDPREPFKEQER